MPEKKHPKGEEAPPEQSKVQDSASEAVSESEPAAEILEPEVPKVDEKEELRRKNEELLTKMKYLQAEFENLQKRTAKEKQEFIAFAQEGVLRSILPVLDDFDKAVELIGDKDGGLVLLRTKLLKVLEENGLSEIPAKGEKFDPFLHEVVQFVVEGDKTEGMIVDVVRKGYRCNLRVLRPSLVVVVKNEGEKNA